MKKLFVIIGVLAIIFFGMVIYRNTANKSNVTVQEVENIEKYISKIYMWKEITNQALPTLENNNEADELWTWEVVKKNLEEFELSYDDIQNKAKELFGVEFSKQFPKEGNKSFIYDETIDKYITTQTDLDTQDDTFLLSDIKKSKNEYIVEITEYLEDYSLEESIIIRNIQGEEIGKVNTNDNESSIQNLVKNNSSRFSKKKVYFIWTVFFIVLLTYNSENANIILIRYELDDNRKKTGCSSQ